MPFRDAVVRSCNSRLVTTPDAENSFFTVLLHPSQSFLQQGTCEKDAGTVY